MLPAAPNADGTPAWMVHDPVKNRFYRIGWIDFEILLRWSQRSARAVVEAVNAQGEFGRWAWAVSLDRKDVGRLLDAHDNPQSGG